MLAGSMVGWISLDVLSIGQTGKRSALFGPFRNKCISAPVGTPKV
jgi:hypothetical protein